MAVIAQMGGLGPFLFLPQPVQPCHGAETAVSVPLGDELFGVFPIDRQAFRLEVRAEIAADPGAFIPVNIQPIQAVEDGVHGAGDEPFPVGVLDADDEAAAVVTGKEPVEKGGADVADMRVTGRAGRIADADVVGHFRFLGYVRNDIS